MIDGTTVHSLCGIAAKAARDTNTKSDTLVGKWAVVKYVLVDEVSMLGQRLLAKMSRNITKAKQSEQELAFGGVNIVFFGDFNQFPPVLDVPLFVPAQNPSKGLRTVKQINCDAVIGRQLWIQVDTMVQLKQQMRAIGDPRYQVLLSRVRVGKTNAEDHALLRTRIHGTNGLSALSDDFKSAPIVVMTNELKDTINDQKLKQLSFDSGAAIYSWKADDAYAVQDLKDHLPKSIIDQINALPVKQTENLPKIMSLTVGAPVSITKNVAVELNITNGTTGIVEKFTFAEKDSALADMPQRSSRCSVIPEVVYVRIKGVDLSTST